MRAATTLASVLFTACASALPPPAPAPAAPEQRTEEVAEAPPPPSDAVSRGELPWWHGLAAGVYRYRGEVVVLAVGGSTEHHHPTEGFLQAKVTARLAVRKAAAAVSFAGPMPEPELSDLFVTRKETFLALHLLRVPDDATPPSELRELSAPPSLAGAGRRRLGRHVFERDRHLYLECDVEGPVANPDWGRSRATARLSVPGSP